MDKEKQINWVKVYNKLFELINTPGDTYYSGSQFLNAIRAINYNVPSYNKYIEQRKSENKSTSRKDFFHDVLMEQPENERIEVIKSILDAIEHIEPEKTLSIRELLDQSTHIQGPQAEIPIDLWNADRLREDLKKMDESIDEGNYKYTLTLSYTCLEGFYKSFIKENIPSQNGSNKLTVMAKEIRSYLKNKFDSNNIPYPKQVIDLISTVTGVICNARYYFSASHSGHPAQKSTAIYIRDNVNALVKLILNLK